MRTPESASFQESSDNVFADLGLPHPDMLLLKTQLMLRIREELVTRKWDTAHTAAILAVPRRDVERLELNDPDALTLDALTAMLMDLGYDVSVRVSPAASPTGHCTADLVTPAPSEKATMSAPFSRPYYERRRVRG